MDLQSNPVNEILYINFNQDCTCFVCGTETGFRVYNTDPFRMTSRRDFNDGGYGIVGMLFRTNIIAIVGGGRNPAYQPHKVVIWDDRHSRVLAEFSFRSVVKSVVLRRDLVIVAIVHKIYVYGFCNLTLLDSLETISNPKGLCCVSPSIERAVLACPGMQTGHVLVVVYPRAYGSSSTPAPHEKTSLISAHGKSIAALGINPDGTLLTTASDKGTIVRVFDTATGTQLHELRRGADSADVHSLTFSPAGEWLAVSSDKGTVHLFAVGRGDDNDCLDESGLPSHINTRSSLKRFARLLPSYFSSEWSLAQFHVPDYRCISAFGQEAHTVVVLCANGSYYKARFDPVHGGEMVREGFARFDDAAMLEPAFLDSLGGNTSEHSRIVSNQPGQQNN